MTDTYTLAVFADDGFNFSGIGLVLTNTTSRAAITTETASGVVLTPGLTYNFSLAYMNYTTATTSTIQLLWRRAGGPLEIVPREAIHARGRRDYYRFGGAVVAMKDGVMNAAPRTLSYLHGDHLGSASLTTDISGMVVSQQRYKPYGEVRWSSGSGMPTDKQFTSQIRLNEGYVGTLYDYVARAYDPALGRFISADTIVPGAGNSQAFNRYSYVSGNPLGKIDPSGHYEVDDDGWITSRGAGSTIRHNAVVVSFAAGLRLEPDGAQHDIRVELRIPGAGLGVTGFGRADIVDMTSMEAWEAKPNSDCGRSRKTQDQLQRYTEHLGTSFGPGHGLPSYSIPDPMDPGNGRIDINSMDERYQGIVFYEVKRRDPRFVPVPVLVPDAQPKTVQSQRPATQPAYALQVEHGHVVEGLVTGLAMGALLRGALGSSGAWGGFLVGGMAGTLGDR